MSYFPLFIDLEKRKVLVAGAGAVGARRIAALSEFGADVVVVAEAAEARVERLAGEGHVKLFRGSYAEYRDLLWNQGEEESPFFLVLAATGDPYVDEAVAQDGRSHGAFVNCAGDRSRSDFYFPGLAKEGAVTAGVIAGGIDHRLAKVMTERIREVLKTEGAEGKDID